MIGFLHRKTENPRLAQIRKIVLFATLANKELRVIDSLLFERTYQKDEIVFDQGEEGQALYVVLSGRILICRSADGVEQVLAENPAGSLFGELALLGGSPRSAQARAAEDSVLAALSRADFESLMEMHAAIASKVAMQLARDLGRKLGEGNSTPEPGLL